MAYGTVPEDPAILVSVLNTKLRDFYASLGDLCDDLELNEDEMKKRCARIGYAYDADKNQFI